MNKTDDVSSLVFQEILNQHKILRDKKRQEWDRVLPFDELVFDRWEKAKYIDAGKGSSIYHSSHIFGKVKIGKNTWIGPYTILDGSGGGIVIGDYCSISAGTQIYTHDTVKWSLTGGKTKKENGAVRIGNYCYIGPNCVISKKTKIGSRSIIGAQSFINKDVPPNSFVFGVPGKVMGKVIVKGKTYRIIKRNKNQ